jgi:SAM-dependent methyltransferase
MESIEFERMAAVEDTMWWYHSLHSNLFHCLRRFLTRKQLTILDAGCGTGGLIRFLKKRMTSVVLIGIDAEPEACHWARTHGCNRIGSASVNELPFLERSFDSIISADVLCHRQVDPEKAMLEFHRCLRPGGILVIQLPAYEWLRSYHDEQVHSEHRFTEGEVLALFKKSGFSVTWSSYWNSLPFPLLLLRRFVFPPGKKQSDVQNYSKFVQWILSTIMFWEENHLKRGGRYRWGASILTVGSKLP